MISLDRVSTGGRGMTDMTKLSTCQITCWSLSALAGVLLLWATIGPLGVVGGLILAVVVGMVMALLFTRLVCTGQSADDPGIQPGDLKHVLKNVTGVTFYKAPLDEDDLPPGTSQPDATGTSVPTGGMDRSTAGGQASAPDQAGSQDEANDTPRSDVGTRPEKLAQPRGGQADDLKQIKGVGPKLESLCHDMGVYHFDQIAGWTAAEVAWVDENLVGFAGRVSRDDWVAQAKILAAGGETEFSRRTSEDDMK